MRKTWTYGALLIACHAGAASADAAYVIKLKNGNEYVTSRYWNEGGQVLFDTYNGVFGVDRAFIRAIERSERALSPAIESTAKESRPDAEPKRAPEAASGNANIEPSHNKSAESAKTKAAPPEPKEALKKDEDILKQYGELQQRFGQLNDLPKHEVYALDADIESFRNKVLSSELAEAHKEEMDALATLQKAIRSYLKAAYP